MMRAYGLMAALCAMACADAKQSHLPVSDWPTWWNALGMEHFTLPARAPIRIDTLRDSGGRIFSARVPTGVAFTRAGNIAVLETARRQLLLFDTSGREMRRVDITSLDYPAFPTGIFILPGDSIAVWDWASRRMSLFDASLTLDRTERFALWESSDRELSPAGRLDDGRWVWLVVPQRNTPFRRRMNPFWRSELQTVVDTPRLMVGRSDEAPVEFHRLPSRRGVHYVTRTDSGGTSSGTLWPAGWMDVRVGAVCTRGVVLLDPDSVRVLDASGRVVSVARIPRQGDTIRSPIDPAGFVYPISSTDRTFARRLRSELEKLVSTWKVGGRDPLIDLGGRFWYFRRDTTHRPLFVLDRVDDAGQPDVALLQDSFGQWRMRVGANSVATIRYRPDTTAIIAVTRFAEPFSRSGDGSLGRCSASFGY